MKVERVQIKRKDDSKPARDFNDCEVIVNRGQWPDGVEWIELI